MRRGHRSKKEFPSQWFPLGFCVKLSWWRMLFLEKWCFQIVPLVKGGRSPGHPRTKPVLFRVFREIKLNINTHMTFLDRPPEKPIAE